MSTITDPDAPFRYHYTCEMEAMVSRVSYSSCRAISRRVQASFGGNMCDGVHAPGSRIRQS